MAALPQTVLAATITFARMQTSLSVVVPIALEMMIAAVTKGQVHGAVVNSVVAMVVVVLMMARVVVTGGTVLIMVTVVEAIVVMLVTIAGLGLEAVIHSWRIPLHHKENSQRLPLPILSIPMLSSIKE